MLQFKKSELRNGVRIVSELHPHSHSVAIGIWVLTGTRDEGIQEMGISHFLEHIVFKGTKSKTAFQIAKSLECLGGELNAYTTREYTCYHALVLKDHWEKALEVLSDLVSNMSITREDFIVEKSVILQEIAMSDDGLEELIYDIYLEKALGPNPLGWSILGTQDSIKSVTQGQVKAYYKNKYSGNNIIVSAAGCLDHQSLYEGVSKYLGKKRRHKIQNQRRRPRHKAFRALVEKDTEQLHLLMGLPCTSFTDSRRFEAFVVNALLGGGMTSKLYQGVREKRGLVYSIYSSLNTFEDFGLINIYAACEPKNMKAVIKNIISEVRRLRAKGLSENELELFKTQVMGGILLGADDMENRMSSLGVNEMVFEKYRPIDQLMDEIKRVSVESVCKFIEDYLNLEDAGILLVGGQAEQFDSFLQELIF